MSIDLARIVRTRSPVSYRPCGAYNHALCPERPVSHLRFANHLCEFFLSKRYGDVLSEEDLQVINSECVALYLIYKGTCPKTNSRILERRRQ